MSVRLPQVGGDDGSWGQLLNDFLKVAHEDDGSLKLFGHRLQKLKDENTITTDVSQGDICFVTLGGDRTLANPINAKDGMMVRWRIQQDEVGKRTLNLGDKFKFGVTVPKLTLSQNAKKADWFGAVYIAESDTWEVLAVVTGYN